MKKVYSFCLIFVTFISLSQNNLSEILRNLTPINGKTEIDISSNNLIEYRLGINNTKDLMPGKIIEVLQNNSNNPRFYLVPLEFNNGFQIYTLLNYEILTQKVDTILPEAFNFYILFDVKNNCLLYLEAKRNGSVYKTKKDKIILDYDLFNSVQVIYKLDDMLRPTTGVFCYEDDGLLKYDLFTCEYDKLQLKIKTTIYDGMSSSVFLMPYEKLINNLNLKPDKYNYIKECGNNYCYLQILNYLNTN